MVVNRRKKNSRQRASWNHGWGSRKKHRGSGSRGGKGMAGSGKRADQKKPSIWKERYFGKNGFKKKGYVKISNIINIIDIEQNIDRMVEQKLALKEGDGYSIDLTKQGYDKLLSTGSATKKYKIIVEEASKKAIEKIESKGGEVIVQSAKGQ